MNHEPNISPFKRSPFFYLNASQFFSSVNDNIYKYLLIYSVIDAEGLKSAPFVLSASGIIFILPFLFFSFSSGIIADRYSKRNVIVLTKAIEVFTVCLLLVSFIIENTLLRYIGLFILATEEALISPAKYSIVPELVPKDQITRANGYLVSFTYTGMMLGALLSSVLVQITHHDYVFSSLSCIIVAALGLFTALKLPVTHAFASKAKIKVFFLGDIVRTVKRAAMTPYLVACMLGSSFFLFLAAYSQANIIAYSVSCLNLSDVAGGYYSFITTVGVCIGGVSAGTISGPRAALGLVPLGMLGIMISFFLFDLTIFRPFWTAMNTLVIGIFAGLYLVPQDSYVQAASGNEVRGQNVATTNFFGWCSVLLASFLFYFMRHTLDLNPKVGFEMLGFMCLAALILFSDKFVFPMIRLTSSILLKVRHFRIEGTELIPSAGAALIVVKNTGEAFYLLSYRPRIIQLTASYPHVSWEKRMAYKRLTVVPSENILSLLDEQKLCCYIQEGIPEDQAVLKLAEEKQLPTFTASFENKILQIREIGQGS